MKEHIVYWAEAQNGAEEYDWNLLYYKPESLYKELTKNINKDNSSVSFFECPAFKDIATHTFIIKNPLNSGYIIENDNIIPQTNCSIFAEIIRQPAISNNILIRYNFPIILFSEEPINVSLLPPYLHKPGYLNYGAIIPGKYDISSWFRPMSMEINLWDSVKEFHIKEDEPLAYISFDTEKRIKLVRFSINDELFKILNSCSSAGRWEPKVPLIKRYKRFNETKTNNIVLKNIKENIIE